MKKLTLLLLLIVVTAVSASAQTLVFKATHYSQQFQKNGHWEEWSDWEPSSVKIDMNLDTDVVKVYSKRTQVYNIYEFVGESKDDGDTTITYRFIDQDGDKGNMRLLMRKSGRSEIYFDFANVRWAYIVLRE